MSFSLLSSGHASKVEAILQMLRYAEQNHDLTAGLVVAAIGACRWEQEEGRRKKNEQKEVVRVLSKWEGRR
jgi:hypothetical protein